MDITKHLSAQAAQECILGTLFWFCAAKSSERTQKCALETSVLTQGKVCH